MTWLWMIASEKGFLPKKPDFSLAQGHEQQARPIAESASVWSAIP